MSVPTFPTPDEHTTDAAMRLLVPDAVVLTDELIAKLEAAGTELPPDIQNYDYYSPRYRRFLAVYVRPFPP